MRRVLTNLHWKEEVTKGLFLGKGTYEISNNDFYVLWIEDEKNLYNVQYIDADEFDKIVEVYLKYKGEEDEISDIVNRGPIDQLL